MLAEFANQECTISPHIRTEIVNLPEELVENARFILRSYFTQYLSTESRIIPHPLEYIIDGMEDCFTEEIMFVIRYFFDKKIN